MVHFKVYLLVVTLIQKVLSFWVILGKNFAFLSGCSDLADFGGNCQKSTLRIFMIVGVLV